MRKGQKMSEEQKRKIALAHTGMKAPIEVRLKMSLAKKGKPSWNKGIPMRPESKIKLSLSKKGQIPWNKKLFRPKNVSRAAFTQRIRRQRLETNGGKHSIEQWEELKANHKFACIKCKLKEPEIKLTRDHILAISRGGTDDIKNIQPMCLKCNQSKWAN